MGARPGLLAALFVTTLVTLVIELDFTRLVSMLFLPNDAYWVIAIALLGAGIGGALVAVISGRLAAAGSGLLAALMLGIGGTAVLPPLLFRYLSVDLGGAYRPDNPVLLYLLVALPCLLTFLLSSIFVSTILMRFRDQVGRLYFVDLVGAAVGCGVFHFLLVTVGVERSLVAAAAIVTVASLLLIERPSVRTIGGLVVTAALIATAAWVGRGPSPLLPLYGRELRMLMDWQADRVELDFQGWDPVARIDILSVAGHELSLPDRARYKLLTQDGGAPSILLGFDRPIEELEFPDRSLLGAAYWHRHASSVLIIGPGGGPDVVTALHYAPDSLTVVELNRTTIHAVGEVFRDFTGDLYGRPGVRIVHDDGRHFVRASDDRYDVIQLTGVDTLVLQAGGNLSENYLYTVEAFRDYFDHLTPDGALSITYPHLTRWGVRATAMLLKVVQDSGVGDPGRHLVVSMSGGYVNLLVKRSPFEREEVAALRSHFGQPLHGLLLPLFYELWGQHIPKNVPSLYVFPPEALAQQGVLYDPFDASPNPYSQLVAAWRAAPDSKAFWSRLGESMAPAYDDRPFFFLPIDAGWTFARRILGLAIPAILFIVAPLAVFRRRGLRTAGAPLLAVYFAGLGFCFIALEVVLLQKFVLFLGHPALSFTVVLATLLVSTGVGSLVSGRIPGGPRRVLAIGVGAVALYGPVLIGASGALGEVLLRESFGVRVLAVSLGTVPLGVAMGLLFPSGIRLLGDRAREFVPWAWGINASASVIGTLLGLFLAIRLGFFQLALLAVGLYVVAGVAAIAATRSRPDSGAGR